MKTFYLAATAALLLASTAAHAGSNGNSVSFEVNGQKVHIEVPKHCDQLNCIQISAPGLSKSGFNMKGLNFGKSDDDDTADSTPPAKTVPAPAAAPSAPAPTAAPQIQAAAPAPAPAAPAPQIVASTTPAPVVHDVVPSAQPPVAPPAPAPQSAPAVAAPVAANTPVGVWKTEDDKGNVRIEQCGADLCGYAVGSGEKILINMRPEDSKWVGRIHDPDSGRNYDSTIAMKGANTLRVQGCAFGGLFCGGQTWKRIS